VILKASGVQIITVKVTNDPAVAGSANVQAGSGTLALILSRAVTRGDGSPPSVRIATARYQPEGALVWPRRNTLTASRPQTVAQAVDLLEHAPKTLI
jgi:hypothetical protein